MLKLREFLLTNVNKTIHHNIVQQFLCSQTNFHLSSWYLKHLPKLNVPPHLGFSQSWTNSDLPLSEDQVLHYSCSSNWKSLLRSTTRDANNTKQGNLCSKQIPSKGPFTRQLRWVLSRYKCRPRFEKSFIYERFHPGRAQNESHFARNELHPSQEELHNRFPQLTRRTHTKQSHIASNTHCSEHWRCCEKWSYGIAIEKRKFELLILGGMTVFMEFFFAFHPGWKL